MQVARDLYSAAQPIEIQVNLKTAGMNVYTVYKGEYEGTSPPAIIESSAPP
jgi:hypothetical protein